VRLGLGLTVRNSGVGVGVDSALQFVKGLGLILRYSAVGLTVVPRSWLFQLGLGLGLGLQCGGVGVDSA